MESKKIISLLDNTLNKPSKFKTTYSEDNQIRFKTSMLRSSLCDYSD